MCSDDVGSLSPREAADRAHAHFSRARADLLAAVAELASTEDWRGDGAGNLAAWLSARWQISPRTARDLARDADALKARSALGEALARGAVSLDQAKAITVLSKEGTDDDELWLEVLPFWSISELEREARKKTARELERKDDGVYLRMSHTDDERYMRGAFQLHPEDGAVVLAALDALVPNDTSLRDWDRASAMALIEMARGSVADRTTVVLSVSADALAGNGDVARLSSDGFVGAETARRLSCDAQIQVLEKRHDGTITGVGRTSPGVSPALRRAVADRDDGQCTFPGCDRENFLHCHHIVHRAHGGQTVIDNLLLVCWTHHTLLHEGGWSVVGDAGPRITWVRPDGTPFEPRVRVTLDTS